MTRVVTFTTGVALGLSVLTGVAAAEAPATSPSDSKLECSESHHSNTDHGANNDDGYQSTCDPEDFGGNGQEFGPGLQTGEPCAGCVGNADDKNPPGQVPDGSDDNSGYECDGRDRPFENQNGNGNHGVGDENPAHTGCIAATEVPPTDDDDDDDEPELCPDGSAMPQVDVDGNGQINAADCVSQGGNHDESDDDDDDEPELCPDGSVMPQVDVDGNGQINAADCASQGGNHDESDDDDDDEVIDTPRGDVGNDETPVPTVVVETAGEVLGESEVAPAIVPAATPASPATTSAPAEVVTLSAAPAPVTTTIGELAFTGVPTDVLTLLAGLLLGIGTLLTTVGRRVRQG